MGFLCVYNSTANRCCIWSSYRSPRATSSILYRKRPKMTPLRERRAILKFVYHTIGTNVRHLSFPYGGKPVLCFCDMTDICYICPSCRSPRATNSISYRKQPKMTPLRGRRATRCCLPLVKNSTMTKCEIFRFVLAMWCCSFRIF